MTSKQKNITQKIGKLTTSIHYYFPNKDNRNKLKMQAVEGKKLFATHLSVTHLAEP